MRELLGFFERELAFLRQGSAEFAREHPRIASRLAISPDVADDPHVERVIQSFALLAARVHKRLDDDFPQFTESLLDVLHPQYLRPFPSCAIVQFDPRDSASQSSLPTVVARHTMLTSRPVRGVACRFRTAYPVTLLPLAITSFAHRAGARLPEGTPAPAGVGSWLSIELTLTSPQASWAELAGRSVRVFLDGDASQVAALREALLGDVLGVLLQTGPHGPWRAVADALPRPVGFADDEALLDEDARSHPGYHLLAELFTFPEKFAFVDLPLPAALAASRARSATLHVLRGAHGPTAPERLLELASERNLLLGCTPVVNLFAQRADPIRLSHRTESYPVLPDGRRAFGYEVYSVDKVFQVRQTPAGETVRAFAPFYSLSHATLLDEGEEVGRYWHLHRDPALSERSPGYETSISIVDLDFEPALPQTDTLSVAVSATNRDLPQMLSLGNAGGDLSLEGGSPVREIRLLRKPSATHRFEVGHGSQWRLVSHLSLNHLSLTGGGADALKELLRLYDLPRTAGNRRLIEAITQVTCEPTGAFLPGAPFPTLVRGLKVRLALDPTALAGVGVRLVAQVLEHFFARYVNANGFVQLEIVADAGGDVLVSCPRRSGQGPLL